MDEKELTVLQINRIMSDFDKSSFSTISNELMWRILTQLKTKTLDVEHWKEKVIELSSPSVQKGAE